MILRTVVLCAKFVAECYRDLLEVEGDFLNNAHYFSCETCTIKMQRMYNFKVMNNK
jgi:hypothetical protein